MKFFSLLLSELTRLNRKPIFSDSMTKSRIIKKGKTTHYINNKAFGLHTNSQSQFCQNKYLTYQVLQAYKYRIPKSKWIIPISSSLAGPEYGLNAARKRLSKHLGPRIIKPNNKSLGRGVQKLDSINDFEKRVNNHDTEISGGKIDSRIIQEFIPGKDIRVIVINVHDAKNISLGGNALPFHYTLSDQKWIKQLSKKIGISYFGLDIITNGSLQEGIILEINSLPSFEGAIIINSTFEKKFAFKIAQSIDKLYY